MTAQPVARLRCNRTWCRGQTNGRFGVLRHQWRATTAMRPMYTEVGGTDRAPSAAVVIQRRSGEYDASARQKTRAHAERAGGQFSYRSVLLAQAARRIWECRGTDQVHIDDARPPSPALIKSDVMVPAQFTFVVSVATG